LDALWVDALRGRAEAESKKFKNVFKPSVVKIIFAYWIEF
jgi:hypothetical protein